MPAEEQRPPALRLASASPRRRQLLELIGVPHVVTPADIDETPFPGEEPDDYVCRLAREKSATIWSSQKDLPVLAADTTVVIDGEILGKPESEADALRMLKMLSGREHFVFTGVAIQCARGPRVSLSKSSVTFSLLHDAEIRAYWASGEPAGKAGAYAIQGFGGAFISNLAGSHTGVMGLPLYETAVLLRHAGVPVWNGAWTESRA
jgi:septum formation protein